MSRRIGVLDLSSGAVVVVDGVEWLVESFAPQYGHVSLRRGDGTTMRTTVRALLTGQADVVPAGTPTLVTDSMARQPVTLADLTVEQRELALLRLAHVLEVETGFRGGDPLRPGPGEPRPGYDPNATTLTARRLAKVAELKALGGAGRPGHDVGPQQADLRDPGVAGGAYRVDQRGTGPDRADRGGEDWPAP